MYLFLAWFQWKPIYTFYMKILRRKKLLKCVKTQNLLNFKNFRSAKCTILQLQTSTMLNGNGMVLLITLLHVVCCRVIIIIGLSPPKNALNLFL